MWLSHALGKCGAVVSGVLLSVAIIGSGECALSGSTEQIRRAIAKHDFPGVPPVMDTQEQFIVFSLDHSLSKSLLDAALKLRLEIYRFFRISKVWNEPAFILVFPTRERYGLLGTGGASLQFKYRGQSVRMIGSYIQEGLEERILPHEIVHFLIADLSTVGSGREGEPTQLPYFINEGIAEYFSASPGRRLLFEKGAWETFQAGKLEPLSKILTSTASPVEALTGSESAWTQRAQAYSVVSFLASLPDGNVKLRNYISIYGTSVGRVPRESASLRAFETAFRQDYSSWEGLQNRWVQYILDREIVVWEGESAKVVDSSGEQAEVRSISKEKLLLSGEKELLFHAAKEGSFVSLQSSLTKPGAFDVYAMYTQGPRSGRFRLALNGKEFPAVFDAYARTEKICEPAYYGKSVLPAGTVTTRFTVVGKATVSGGFDLGIDCLLLRRDRLLEQRNSAAAQTHLRTGADFHGRRLYKEAEASFTAAINLAPWDATALEWRAYARVALGRLDDAERDADAAVKLAPANSRLIELKKRIEAARKGPGRD
jgi:tetratricopeptide (TPR) repeat protein